MILCCHIEYTISLLLSYSVPPPTFIWHMFIIIVTYYCWFLRRQHFGWDDPFQHLYVNNFLNWQDSLADVVSHDQNSSIVFCKRYEIHKDDCWIRYMIHYCDERRLRTIPQQFRNVYCHRIWCRAAMVDCFPPSWWSMPPPSNTIHYPLPLHELLPHCLMADDLSDSSHGHHIANI